MWSYNIAAAPPLLANGPIRGRSAGLPFEASVVVVVLPSNRNRHISGRSCVDGSSCNWERETEEGGEEVQEERDGWEVSHAVSASLASFESLFPQPERRRQRGRQKRGRQKRRLLMILVEGVLEDSHSCLSSHTFLYLCPTCACWSGRTPVVAMLSQRILGWRTVFRDRHRGQTDWPG